MRTQAELVIIMSPVGDTRHGLWCDVCALPSAIFQRFALRSEAGRSMGTYDYKHCLDHDGPPWPSNEEHGRARWSAEHLTEEV